MSLRARRESARRVSDCVTALLRDQPFFGSLALRLPIRADAGRETLASDGQEIRYSPEWVADTDADLIKTAIGRVVLACALKHHTRRAERDPQRWQRASQLVTHGVLRDAGFKLPLDAEAWDGISVEQAYDSLPEPQDGDGGGDDSSRGTAGDDGCDPPDPQSGAGDDDDGHDSSDRSDPARGDDPQGEDSPGEDQDDDHPGEDAPCEGEMTGAPTFDPSGTGEVIDAAARDSADAGDGQPPMDINDEEQAWDEAMHQALNLAKAQGKAPGVVEETIRGAHASTLDWRTLLRRYMTDAARSDYSWSLPNRRFIDSGLYLPSIRSEGIDTIAVIIDTLGLAACQDARRVLDRGSRHRRGASARGRHRHPGRFGPAGCRRVRARRLARRDRAQGTRRNRLPAGLRLVRRAGPAPRRVPLPHRHGVRSLPGRRAAIRRALVRVGRGRQPLAATAPLGRSHPDQGLILALPAGPGSDFAPPPGVDPDPTATRNCNGRENRHRRGRGAAHRRTHHRGRSRALVRLTEPARTAAPATA